MQPVRISRLEKAGITDLGERVTLEFRSEDGSQVSVHLDSDELARTLPALHAIQVEARKRAEAGLPAIGVPGERMSPQTMKPQGFAVHPSVDGQGCCLELFLPPGRWSFPLNLTAKQACLLGTHLLAIGRPGTPSRPGGE